MKKRRTGFSVGKGREEKLRSPKIRKIRKNAAGIDVGSRVHYVAVPDGQDGQKVRSFGTFTRDLHDLADWLQECGIETVAMESTGFYWIPLCEVLEERGFDVYLVNARHVKALPGRKSDVLDCQWIQELHACGLLRRSFRPSAAMVPLRNYVRQRASLVELAAQQIQRMQLALTLMNVLLHNVVSDITGVTGMKIVRAIVAGQRDREALAALRDYRCGATVEEFVASLTGTFHPEHLVALRHALEGYDFHHRQIDELDVIIERELDSLQPQDAPNLPEPPPARPTKAPKRTLRNEPRFEMRDKLYRLLGGVDLTQIPALAPYSVLRLLSEIGDDYRRWPTSGDFCSWLNLAPGTRKTGGVRVSGRRPKSRNRAAQILRLAVLNIGKTQTALGAFHRRMSARLDPAKAIVATAHKLARIIYAMLRDRSNFVEPGAHAYDAEHRERAIRRMRAKAHALGFQLSPIPDQDVSASSVAVP